MINIYRLSVLEVYTKLDSVGLSHIYFISNWWYSSDLVNNKISSYDFIVKLNLAKYSIVDQKSHKSKIVWFDNLIIGAISGAASNFCSSWRHTAIRAHSDDKCLQLDHHPGARICPFVYPCQLNQRKVKYVALYFCFYFLIY